MEERHGLINIINFLPDPTWAININGVVIAWNKAAEEMTGIDSKDILGKGDYEYALPFYGIRCPILIDLALSPDIERENAYKLFNRKEDMVESEIFLPDFRGNSVHIWAKARQLRNSKGNITGAIETVRDITRQKKMQEALFQSEKMSMIAGLASGIAHEVNNPLGVIAQDLQNLKRRLSPMLPANQKVANDLNLDLELVSKYLDQRNILTFIENMQNAVKRASNIMKNMLQFSITGDKSHQNVFIDEIIEQSITLASNDYNLKKKYNFRNIKITRLFDSSIPSIPINISEIEQVVINILKNSAQAMYEANTKAPEIIIRTDFNANNLTIQFCDNGPGIAHETCRTAFEPFFTTREVGKGTGLGLSVSYSIVKNHGGNIAINQNNANGGTCVTISLPLAKKE